MRVIGSLIWADEDPTLLMASIAALAPLLDHLVALDGKYFLFPGALSDPASSVDQSCAILEACAAAGLAVTLFRPSEPFMGNEVEKRQLSVTLADAAKASEDDWMVVFDADTVARSFDPAFLRADLERSDHMVAEYALFDNPADDGYTAVRGIYRLAAGLEYGPTHYSLSAPTSKPGERLWLWGDPRFHQPYAEAFNLHGLRFDHRRGRRDQARRDKAAAYYAKRDQLGVERLGETFVKDMGGQWVNVRERDWAQDAD